jgi:hypothetical protein
MKQIVFTLICASIFGATNAQVSYGVKGGLSGVGKLGTGINVGIHAGVFAGVRVSESVSIQPELFYSAFHVASKYYHHHLNFPVLIKLTGDSGFFGETGPQGKLWMNNIGRKGITFDQRASFGWAFGFGYKPSPTRNIGFDLRYVVGRSGELQLGVFYVLRSK